MAEEKTKQARDPRVPIGIGDAVYCLKTGRSGIVRSRRFYRQNDGSAKHTGWMVLWDGNTTPTGRHAAELICTDQGATGKGMYCERKHQSI
jgi:hypothetical protein